MPRHGQAGESAWSQPARARAEDVADEPAPSSRATLPPGSGVWPLGQGASRASRPSLSDDAAPATVRAPSRKERRRGARVTCHLRFVDADRRAGRTEDLAASGIRYSVAGPPRRGPHEVVLSLPSPQRSVRLLAHPVWSRLSASGCWEVGARVEEVEPGELRRYQFAVNALMEGLDLREIRFVPLALMEQAPDRRAERARLRALEIDPVAARAAECCAEIAPRPPFLWQWAKEAIAVTTLPSVAPEHLARVREIKLCASIFFTAVDDVADALQDAELFEQVLVHVFRMRRDASPPTPARARQLRRLGSLWRYLSVEARRLPRHAEMKGLFEFDCGTFLHGVAHALLLQSVPEAACVEEPWTAAFMPMFADLDLMCSPGFDRRDLGAVRGVVVDAQQMVVLANALGTWEREVRAGDHSSVVVGAAVRKGVVTGGDLQGGTPPETLIARIRASDVEVSLMVQWERHWRSIHDRSGHLSSLDLAPYLRGLEQVFQLQMMSRGLV